MSAARSGRAGTFSLGLAVGFLLCGYALLRVLDLQPAASPPEILRADAVAAPALGSWHARLVLGVSGSTASPEGAVVLARLLPLHDEASLEAFRASALRERYGLPEGRPWRLYLALEERDEGARTEPIRVRAVRAGSGADALVPLAECARAPEGAGVDPLFALLAAPPGPLEAGRARPMVLWGTGEWGTGLGEAGALTLELGEPVPEGLAARVEAPLVADEEPAEMPRWYAGEAAPTRVTLSQEVARLRQELERERARGADREEAFLQFSRLLSELPAGQKLGLGPASSAEPSAPTEEELERKAAAEAAAARAEELGRSLSVLMRVEGLRGLDLMEAGSLLSGPPSAIGPVVFRCLDERGLLAGSVGAARLRLEGSLAAHTLTLVLEDGFESRGGERVPFADGVRRITLHDVDPAPWRQECPELFDGAELERGDDDGLWDPGAVRRALNELLGLDPRLGWYRLHSLGGVRGPALLDVQLEELDPSGRLQRRIFADALTIALEDGSVVLELEDGAFVRGEEKQPFRDGHHRIVLPAAPLASWRAAALPGLSAPPPREKPAEEDAPGG